MSDLNPVFTTRIQGCPRVIFDLIADMPNYGCWLRGSEAFGGTTNVSPYPVRLGTTYLDAGAEGERPGTVTEYDPPHHIGFHHTMLLRKGPLAADIDVRIRYTLEPQEDATNVIRALDMRIRMRGLMKIAQPLVVRGFRRENERILAALQSYAEAQTRKRPV